MERWLLAFFIGGIFSLFLPITPNSYYVIFFALVAMLFVVIRRLRFVSGFIFAIVFVLFHAGQYQSIWQTNNLKPIELKNKWHQVEGEIVSLPSITDKGIRFNVEIYRLNGKTLVKNIHLRLRWSNINQPVLQGQIWQLKVKFKPAHGFANPASFSYQTWLRQKGIHATGYVANKDSKQTIKLLQSGELNLRQGYLQALQSVMPEHPLSSLVYALGFGERSKISAEQWQTLESTGTQHLIAISGLHLGLVAVGTFFFFTRFLRCIPLLAYLPKAIKTRILCCNYQHLGVFLSVASTLFYGYLADFSLPTMRALIMLVLYWLARLNSISLRISTWLLLSLFFIVIFEPFSLFSASFWLSVYAVSVIFITLWRVTVVIKQNKVQAFLVQLFVIQFGLSMLMLPIIAIYSQKISLVAFIANFIAVPWMSFTAIPLIILGLVFLPLSVYFSAMLLSLALWCLSLIWHWLQWLAEFNWALMPLSQSSVAVLTFTIVIICIFWLTPVSTFWRNRLAVISLSVFCLSSYSFYPTKAWRLNVMDVGQGLAIVIEKNERVIVYDTGASYPSGFNLAESVLLPYLKAKGIKEIDKVIISHKDNDHAGGLSKITQYFPTKTVMANAAKLKADSPCTQANSFYWQGLYFDVLSPNNSSQSIENSNDRSCVIRIHDKRHSILLTGDISKNVEGELLLQKAIKPTDILVVAHHGSSSSSSVEFLKMLSPQQAIVSAGFYNRWNMPNEKVLARLNKQDVEIINTAENGMVRIDFKEGSYQIIKYRQKLWPFWFAN